MKPTIVHHMNHAPNSARWANSNQASPSTERPILWRPCYAMCTAFITGIAAYVKMEESDESYANPWKVQTL
jgi:hypothetical protein